MTLDIQRRNKQRQRMVIFTFGLLMLLYAASKNPNLPSEWTGMGVKKQVLSLTSTEGLNKVEVMAARIRDINPAIQLRVLNEFVKDDRTDEILEEEQFDYAVDCIDTLSPKVFFIKACLDKKIPIVSSMGAGGKVDPSQIKVVDISKTYQCNLAKYVRKRLYHLGTRKGVKVVFSPEAADKSKIIETPNAFPKKSIIGTVSYMPAMFGCTMASVVIRDLMEA